MANDEIRRGRGKIYDSITDTVGDTPLVRLDRIAAMKDVPAHLVAKLEFFNPIASVKDRIGVAMVDALEEAGRINPGVNTLIEPTSGNTGIALAFVAAARGYRLILTMPETMSVERRKMLRLLGAELVLTEGAKGMRGAMQRAEELLEGNPRFGDPAAVREPGQSGDPPAHDGRGNLERHQGEIDAFVAGIGTGGTITGVGQVLKQRSRAEGRRRRAGREPGAFRRQARPAQDPGHRRRLRAGHARHHDL